VIRHLRCRGNRLSGCLTASESGRGWGHGICICISPLPAVSRRSRVAENDASGWARPPKPDCLALAARSSAGLAGENGRRRPRLPRPAASGRLRLLEWLMAMLLVSSACCPSPLVAVSDPGIHPAVERLRLPGSPSPLSVARPVKAVASFYLFIFLACCAVFCLDFFTVRRTTIGRRERRVSKRKRPCLGFPPVELEMAWRSAAPPGRLAPPCVLSRRPPLSLPRGVLR